MLRNPTKNKGSVLMASIILMVIAALATVSWLGFINASYKASSRDWEQTQAFYAAESGIERVVGLFNDPVINNDDPEQDVVISFATADLDGVASFSSDGAMSLSESDLVNQPTNYPLMHDVHPTPYLLFEPYVVAYALDETGQPLYNETGELVITNWTYFQDLAAGSDPEVSKTSKIPSCKLDVNQFPELVVKSPDGEELASVSELELIHPIDIEIQDGSLPQDVRIVSKLVATGISRRTGVEIKIETLLTENPAYNLSMPGAIISDASAQFRGNFNVHWGELWAKDDILLPANFLTKIPRYDEDTDYDEKKGYDTWFRLRTQGQILDSKGNDYADGRVSGGFSGSEIASGSPVYTAPYLEDYLDVKNKKKFIGLENMLQHQDLTFPNYSYSDWKMLVTTYGFGYYFTYTDGLVYGVESNSDSVDYGSYVGKSYDSWFGISPDDPDYDEMTQKLVFIDSVPINDDGQVAPREGGVPVINSEFYPRDPDGPVCKMITIKLAGGSLHTRGAMFIVANMDMNGQGNPPSSDDVPGVIMPNFEKPDEEFKIFHNGLLYCWGTVEGGGNRTIYGCIYTRGGYDANGTPAVYYNVRMRDGSWLNFNVSRVLRTSWDIVSSR